MGDEVDAQRRDWKRLDEGFAGVTWVTPGTVPDETILYDGMLVAEDGTGKVWRAVRNTSGGFSRLFIKFPWVYVGSTTFTAPHASSSFWGTVPIDSRCCNAGSGDLNAQAGLIIPLKGIYEIITYFFCTAPPTTFINTTHVINGNRDDQSHIVHSENVPVTGTAYVMSKGQRLLEKGDVIFPGYWQYSDGSGKAATIKLSVSCVKPIGPAE
jgi:hypothetical protein